MRLTELKAGESAVLSGVGGHHHIHERLTEMGFVAGRRVTLLYKAPSGSPLVFEVLGTQVALRRDEAAYLVTGEEGERGDLSVERELGREELVAAMRASSARIDKLEHFGEPDRVDRCGGGCASCPHRRGGCDGSVGGTDRGCRGKDAGSIVVALVGNPNCGKTSLFNALCGGHEHTGNYSGVTVRSTMGETVYKGRKLTVIDLPGTYSLHAFSTEEAYVAHELQKGHIDVVLNVVDVNNLERNLTLTQQTQLLGLPMIVALNIYDEFTGGGGKLDIDELSRRLGMRCVATVARTREGVSEILDEIVGMGRSEEGKSGDASATPQEAGSLLRGIYEKGESAAERRTRVIDRIAAGSWAAYGVFGLLMWLMFWLTFAIGQYPMDWIDGGVGALCDWLIAYLPSGWLLDLLVDGVLGGVGAVAVFLPNILILYCLMTILEDSGYLARAAMLADPALSRIGLHGKSFIPMLMGFGCNVPAIMATRTIETGKARLLTILVTPFMSCSARIPVYTAFAGAFFARHASLVMMGIYALGVVAAVAVAGALNGIIMRGRGSHFVMELPPYRVPDWRSVSVHTWEKGRQYLRKMSGIILVASVGVWALNYITLPAGAGESEERVTLMECVGRGIEPALRPLGFDWRMGVGIVAGVGAKELMVSTLGVLYGKDAGDGGIEDDEDDGGTRLQAALAQHTTPAAAVAYMVFALLYLPCIATLVAIKNETGHWHHALLAGIGTTALAYAAAWVAHLVVAGLM